MSSSAKRSPRGAEYDPEQKWPTQTRWRLRCSRFVARRASHTDTFAFPAIPADRHNSSNRSSFCSLNLICVASCGIIAAAIGSALIAAALGWTVFGLRGPYFAIGTLGIALAAGEAAGGDRRSPMASSAALQVSGELDFPLLDLRVDFNATAVSELQHLYEHSQQHWVQNWRDQLAALPDGRPRPADDGGLNAGVA